MSSRIQSSLLCLSFLVCPPLLAQAEKTDQVARLLEELSNAPAPSGFEGPVRDILIRQFRSAGAEVSTDGLGSVIGVLRGPADGPRIMLAAHMDELGAIVRYTTQEGFVKFQTLGGWFDQALVNQRWKILTNKGAVSAVSGLISVHVAAPADMTRVFPHDDIFLDVGARTKQEAEALGIRPGDAIVPSSSFTALANGRYTGKALDDRVGCVILLEALRRVKEEGIKTPNTIYFVGTVQEEVGVIGAHTAVQAVKPDLGISIEAGVAVDHPGGKPEGAQERLGGGPVLYLADAAMIANLKLKDFVQRVAEESKIPLQTEVLSGGYEDSTELQKFGAGKPAVNIAVATRYLHTHNSVIDRADLDRAVDLLVRILSRLDSKTVDEISRF